MKEQIEEILAYINERQLSARAFAREADVHPNTVLSLHKKSPNPTTIMLSKMLNTVRRNK